MDPGGLYIIISMGLFFTFVAGGVIAIFVFSGRKRDRVRAQVAEYIAGNWTGMVVGVKHARDHQWWQNRESLSAPRLLIHIQYRRDDGLEGTVTVAKKERSGRDDPDWALKYNLKDFAFYATRLPDLMASYTEVEREWVVDTRIQKIAGTYYPQQVDVSWHP